LNSRIALCLVLIALCTTVHAAERQKPYRAPRLADGHADFQGVWKNSNLTPLERTEGFTQLVITAADAKKLEVQYYLGPGANLPDDPGRLHEDRTFEPIRGELCSSQIIDPPSGRIPWNEAYQVELASLRRTLSALDNPEQRPPLERCVGSNGAPPMQPNPEGNFYQFVQTPDTTVILSEVSHDARIVRMNSRHSPAAITSWLGDSIGWWEKDTLVVETTHFASHSAVHMNGRYLLLVSPQTTVIERFTRVSEQELNYVFTVSDPTYYTRPWTGETHLLRSKDRMFEVACHEGNYSMRNILGAARAHDSEVQ